MTCDLKEGGEEGGGDLKEGREEGGEGGEQERTSK